MSIMHPSDRHLQVLVKKRKELQKQLKNQTISGKVDQKLKSTLQRVEDAIMKNVDKGKSD